MPRKKLEDTEKKRVEIRFDTVKHGDVVEFLENQTDNMAGFIRNLVISYVRSQQPQSTLIAPNVPMNNPRPITENDQQKRATLDKDNTSSEQENKKTTKRRLPLHNNVIKGTDISQSENRKDM